VAFGDRLDAHDPPLEWLVGSKLCHGDVSIARDDDEFSGLR
jgi:hypothetical protein